MVAEPKLARAEAVEWLFEGRVTPDVSRFRPDPTEGNATDPQRRFLFDVTPEEFAEARADFQTRYLLDGPQPTFTDRLPKWLSPEVRDFIVQRVESEELRRTALPVLYTFDGQPPWGRVVVWIGFDEFARHSVEVFQYAPSELAFYEQIPGVGPDDARLLQYVYTSFNNDMRYFVEQREMRPSAAREEIARIWGEVFKQIVEAASTILGAGAGISGLNQIAASVGDVLAATLQSFRNKRQLFSAWARQKTLTELVLLRGTTLKGILGDLKVAAQQHDLGRGVYFTTDRHIAERFTQRAASPDNPSVLLRLKVRTEELGDVLDLVNGPLAKQWKELTDQLEGPIANERYHNLLTGFLESMGTTLEAFDTIVAPYLIDRNSGGVQVCIKNDTIVRRILRLAEEVPF